MPMQQLKLILITITAASMPLSASGLIWGVRADSSAIILIAPLFVAGVAATVYLVDLVVDAMHRVRGSRKRARLAARLGLARQATSLMDELRAAAARR